MLHELRDTLKDLDADAAQLRRILRAYDQIPRRFRDKRLKKVATDARSAKRKVDRARAKTRLILELFSNHARAFLIDVPTRRLLA